MKEDNIVNVCPQTFNCPLHIQIMALTHESLHAVHAAMEENIQKRFKDTEDNTLNSYDQFCLIFFDEFACQSAGQFAGLHFLPLEAKKVVNLKPLFFYPCLLGSVLYRFIKEIKR